MMATASGRFTALQFVRRGWDGPSELPVAVQGCEQGEPQRACRFLRNHVQRQAGFSSCHTENVFQSGLPPKTGALDIRWGIAFLCELFLKKRGGQLFAGSPFFIGQK